MVLGVLSIITALHWALAVIPLAGLIVGWIAWKQIRKAPEEWIGKPLVQVGMVLSAALWLAGYAWLYYDYFHRLVPAGYAPITYAMLQPDPLKPTEPIPEKAMDMNDRKVFVQGYMQSRRTITGIKEFILQPANGDCPFCVPTPRPTEKIRVVLTGDLEATYTTHLIGVAGHFIVKPNDPNGIPYAIDADYLR